MAYITLDKFLKSKLDNLNSLKKEIEEVEYIKNTYPGTYVSDSARSFQIHAIPENLPITKKINNYNISYSEYSGKTARIQFSIKDVNIKSLIFLSETTPLYTLKTKKWGRAARANPADANKIISINPFQKRIAEWGLSEEFATDVMINMFKFAAANEHSFSDEIQKKYRKYLLLL